MYDYVLFDLDGTLSDPKEGICKSVQYALHDQGIEEPDIDKLEPFIGPPLGASFAQSYGMDEQQCQKAIKKFRERFETIGIYENVLYPGMDRLLADLCARGCKLAVASSKPREFVEIVLEHFNIRSYFSVVMGSEKDGRRVEKEEVMEETLRLLFPDTFPDFPREKVAMVGDRRFDMEGAKRFGVTAIGVAFGYAPVGELESAGADRIVEDMDGLWEAVIQENRIRRAPKLRPLKKILDIVSPLVYYYLLTTIICLAGQLVIQTLVHGPLSSYGAWVSAHSSQLAVYLNGIANIVAGGFCLWLYGKEAEKPVSDMITRKRMLKFGHEIPCLIVLTISISLFLNLLFSYLQIMGRSEAYGQVSSIQYSVSLEVGLFFYGIVAPLAEEAVFRGLIFGRIRHYFGAMPAVLISALIFGAYHGNIVQFLYAFLMGLLLAAVYEKYHTLYAPVLVHALANLAVYTVSRVAAINRLLSVPVFLVLFVLAAASGMLLFKPGKTSK